MFAAFLAIFGLGVIAGYFLGRSSCKQDANKAAKKEDQNDIDHNQ